MKFLKEKYKIYLLYKDESVYVCMCVCVYVRRPAAGPTQAITPKFGMGITDLILIAGND